MKLGVCSESPGRPYFTGDVRDHERFHRPERIYPGAPINYSINPMKNNIKIYFGVTILICISLYNVFLISLGSSITRTLKSEGLFSLIRGNDEISLFEQKFSKIEIQRQSPLKSEN